METVSSSIYVLCLKSDREECCVLIREYVLFQALPQVFEAFSLFTDGTAACCLEVGELLKLLSVYFVSFLAIKEIHKVSVGNLQR